MIEKKTPEELGWVGHQFANGKIVYTLPDGTTWTPHAKWDGNLYLFEGGTFANIAGYIKSVTSSVK